jgi:hypothetical protein
VLDCPADTGTNATGVATATDGCGQVTVVYSDVVTNKCGGTKVIARTWTATDDCGNSTNGLQTITVRDITPPTITAPTSLVLECPADTSTNATGVAIAADGCSAVTITYSDSVTNRCGGTRLITRTWTATDGCGNHASALQTITVQDTTRPTLTLPPDRVLECPANTTTNNTGVATATDTCSAVAITYSDVVSNTCGGTRLIARTWTAADACGNSVSAIQTITVQDTTSPTLVVPADRVLECPADTRTNVTGVATATDTCSSVTITYSDVVSNTCGGARVISRLWTATDACGNGASAVQTITVRDTTRPVITAPASVVLECPADTTTNHTGVATATDTCSSVAITYSDVVSNSCGGSEVILRTWVATDACGNSASALQTIKVQDTTKPSITAPASVVLECPADTTTNNTGVATATDTCSSVAITFSDVVSNTCGGSEVITRTWTATDACGNRATALQTVTVRDTTRPSITAPQDVVLECPADTTTNHTGVATATDTCSSVVVTYSDAVSNTCGGTRIIARTWTATDACGNRASALQTITVQDTTRPTLSIPANAVLECPADTSTNRTGVATATDTCSSVIVSYSDAVNNPCGGSRVVARTWTATDACGNTVSAVQTITVQDTTRPTISAPASVVLECPADTTTNHTGVATASDTCSSVAISYTDGVSNTCGGARVISRLWTATDACGNSASALQTITVRDTTRPTITAPASLVLECPADTTTNSTGLPTVSDTCSSVAVAYSDVVSNTCGSSRVITRTWTAIDACGNSASAIQTIKVQDTTRPSITAPANLVLECPANTSTNNTGVATATDTCSAVVITYSDVVSNTCGGTRIVARTWVATDACGNSASALQMLTVRDTAKPSLTLPPNLALECPADTSTNSTGVATATDACSAVVVTCSDAVSNTCGGTRIVSRTWTATDACGNTISAVQTIRVQDTTRPSITVPSNLVLECPANTATNNTGVATASDTCSAVAITYSDSVSNVCGGAKVIARNWTATDACGNSASAVQLITLRDTVPPTITIPPSLVLECPADTRTNATGVATATDACSAVAITYSDAVSNVCGGAKVIVRTWTANDGCGNSANGVQTITVQDTTPPTLKVPADIVLQCPGDTRTNVTGVPLAQDGCGAVTVTYSDTVSNSCAQTRTVWRLWTVTDQCGYSTNGVQTITVVDTTKPTISCPAISVQCPGDVPAPYADLTAFRAAGGSASDSCSSALTFALLSDSGLVGSCPGRVTRVYRVTDACGNIADGTQTITVNDTIAPAISCPTNMTVDCGVPLVPANTGQLIASDNCDTNLTLTYTDALVPSSYSLKLYAADPSPDSGPYSPTYLKLSPTNLPCPDSARITGRAADPLRNAVAYGPTAGQLDALTSMGGAPMCFGQVVPFEAVIDVSGGVGSEKGTIEFTVDWATYTTSNNRFGYDTNYMVYCAFVDTADPGLVDPNNNARVESYSSRVINAGTISEQIEGTFRVTGLDTGDRVVVEIWMVLDQAPSGNFGGTIAAGLISAQKASVPPEPISTGVQTTSIGQLSKIGPLPPPQDQPPLPPQLPQGPAPQGCLVAVVNRTWTATDACGNRNSCVQQFTVRDRSAPVLSLPPDLVLECPADTSTNSTGVATASGECSSVFIYYTDAVTNTCAATRVVSRTWTAIDGCGNTTNAVQTITVRDSTPPTLTVPPSLVFEYPAVTTTNVAGVATATDGCGSVTISYSDSVSNTCGVGYVVIRTWTATDTCGNSTNALQTLTVQDTRAPSLTIPGGLVLDCPADTSTNHTGAASATDISGPVLVTYSDVVSNTCGGAKVLARTWTATDACGNSANAVQTITVRDLAPPVITSPAPLVLEAPADTATNATGVPLATDGCSAVTLSFSDVVSNTCGAGQVLTRTWTATDACGNSAVARQTITVRDTTAPALVAPPDLVLECPADTGTNHTGVATATDVSPVTIAYSDSVSNGPGLCAFVVRTWTATDACGNTTNALQTIRVQDTTPPTLSVIPSRSLTATQPLAFDEPVATDACGSATVSVLSTVTNGVTASSMTVTRTWVATDQAGNTNTCQETLTVALAPPPTLATVPLSQNAGFGNAAVLSVVAAGSGPFTYQWQFNGVNLAGATNSTLNLKNLAFTDAGVYTVLVGNGSATVTSPAAFMNVLPRLTAQPGPAGLTLTWTNPFVLQSAPAANGPYADVPGAASPFVQSVSLALKKFFRLRSTPFKMGTADLPGGAVAVSVSGVPGLNFIIQATGDLVHWTNVSTNTAPCLCVDPAGQNGLKFYRVVLAPVPSGVVVPPVAPAISAQPAGETSISGNDLLLNVTATGSGPFSYQWRLNGADLAGATNSSLNLAGLQCSNAGLYSVVVTGPGGSVASAPAMVNVAPRLASQLTGAGLSLTWPSPFILESSPAAAGPFVDVPGATSPWLLGSLSGSQEFYRLRSGPVTLTVTPLPNGQNSISAAGAPGWNFFLQGTTDQLNWFTLVTNTCPSTFIDAGAALSPPRTYRALWAK